VTNKWYQCEDSRWWWWSYGWALYSVVYRKTAV